MELHSNPEEEANMEDSLSPVKRGWRYHAFQWIIVGCWLFVGLTLLAMLGYPGGTALDPEATRYYFFRNFLSELGLTQTYSGAANWFSAVLFFVAMLVAGGCMILFFFTYYSFFNSSLPGKLLAGFGSVAGIASGVFFIGVAFTPANLYFGAHVFVVLWAFRLFPVAVIPYVFAILVERNFPNKYALVFVGFGVLLVVYLWLLTTGPAPDSETGRLIQATGQKIIAYASILAVYFQANGARSLLLK